MLTQLNTMTQIVVHLARIGGWSVMKLWDLMKAYQKINKTILMKKKLMTRKNKEAFKSVKLSDLKGSLSKANQKVTRESNPPNPSCLKDSRQIPWLLSTFKGLKWFKKACCRLIGEFHLFWGLHYIRGRDLIIWKSRVFMTNLSTKDRILIIKDKATNLENMDKIWLIHRISLNLSKKFNNLGQFQAENSIYNKLNAKSGL